MDRTTILPFPLAAQDGLARERAEIDAAIAMVARGVATRVRLVGLADVDEVAAGGLARAQSAGVDFALDRGVGGPPAVIVGPRRQGAI
jgi:hypothetical protein